MEGKIKKTIVYYTDSRLESQLANLVMDRIKKAAGDIPIISVSQEPLAFGRNIFVGKRPRSYLSLYQQVMAGLEEVDDDSIVYLCEHDVFYHSDQFDFMPPESSLIYFNLHRFYYQRNKKYFLRAVGVRALSQCVAYKGVLLQHVKEQINGRLRNVPTYCKGPFTNFKTDNPNIDIRHGGNFSASSRFDANEKSPRILEVPYWGTPRMFQHKTGYRDQGIYTNVVLHNKLNPKGKESPVKIQKYRRNDLPKLFKSIGMTYGAEIGVKKGLFSEVICTTIPDVEMLCIDDYAPNPEKGWDRQEDIFAAAQKRLKKFNVQHIKKSSLQAADDIAPNSLDFVYIDANHEFKHVMQDIILWTDRVRRGGIVSGHDYGLEIGGVKDAVDAYCRHYGIELFLTGKHERYPDNVRSWFFAKG